MKKEDRFLNRYEHLPDKDKEIYIAAFWEAVNFLKKQEVKEFEREINKAIRD
ncbi:MAG: hypothetical protein K9K76_09140 [Halanaerobiales bacterium]|nr:hypothetical protein [Halanaerobiales bacterium]